MNDIDWFVSTCLGRPSLLDVREADTLAATWALARAGQPRLDETRLTQIGEALVDRMRGEARPGKRFGYRVENGVAVIPVIGRLVPRGQFAGEMGGYTSYEGLISEIRDAGNDRSVQSVAYLYDTPGGAARGVNAAGRAIRELAKIKPSVSIVNGMCCSGGYWLASQAGVIIADDPGDEIGSIGVAYVHFDVSKLLADIGVKPTVIFAGAHKVDGHPFEPLPEAVRNDIQSEVDKLRLSFARAVAVGRPGLPSDEAMATEARVFPADEAVTKKLIDGIAPLDQVLTALTRYPRSIAAHGGITISIGGPAMTDKQARIDAIKNSPEAKGREALAAHLADNTDMKAEDAIATLKATPVAAKEPVPPTLAPNAETDPSKVRIAAIMNAPEAKGRDDTAKHLALNTDLTLEAAIAVLKVTPEVKPQSYRERKAEAGTLGLGDNAPAPDAGKAGWGKAVTRVNAGVTDPRAVGGR